MALVESSLYGKDKTEEDLHQLIAKNPQLITVEDSEGRKIPVVTIGSHLRFPDGKIDLLLIDIRGNLALVELKRDKTPRDVIAQILDYASILYQSGVEGIEESIKVQSTFTNGLQDVTEKFREDYPDYSEELEIDAIRKKMDNSVNGRDLQLLIVSYEVGEPIKRVTEYLREVYGVKIYCVEFDYFPDKENEYFVPEIIGAEDVRKIKWRERKELTKTQIEYQNFYGELLANLGERLPGYNTAKSPPSKLVNGASRTQGCPFRMVFSWGWDW